MSNRPYCVWCNVGGHSASAECQEAWKSKQEGKTTLTSDVDVIESLLEGYDWLGTGSSWDSKGQLAAESAWKRIKAALGITIDT